MMTFPGSCSSRRTCLLAPMWVIMRGLMWHFELANNLVCLKIEGLGSHNNG